MTEITMDEWLSELEELRADCVRRQRALLTAQQYEIIKTARENDTPIPWDKIAKFFNEKGICTSIKSGKTLKRAYEDYEIEKEKIQDNQKANS